MTTNTTTSMLRIRAGLARCALAATLLGVQLLGVALSAPTLSAQSDVYFTPDFKSVYRLTGGSGTLVYTTSWTTAVISGLAVDSTGALYTLEIDGRTAVVKKAGVTVVSLPIQGWDGALFVDAFDRVFFACVQGTSTSLQSIAFQIVNGQAVQRYTAPIHQAITGLGDDVHGNLFVLTDDDSGPNTSGALVRNGKTLFPVRGGSDLHVSARGDVHYAVRQGTSQPAGELFLLRAGASTPISAHRLAAPWVFSGVAADCFGNFVATVSDSNNQLSSYLMVNGQRLFPFGTPPGTEAGRVFATHNPVDTTTIGRSTGSCGTVEIDATLAGRNLRVSIRQAKPGSVAFLMWSPARLTTPVQVGVLEYWLAGFNVVGFWQTDPTSGAFDLDVPYAPFVGGRLYLQWFSDCGTTPQLGQLSAGLEARLCSR